MTAKDFTRLPELDRLQKICQSSCIMKRQDDKFDYELFQIDGFYVEASFFLDTLIIDELKIFSDTELLKPYLTLININELCS